MASKYLLLGCLLAVAWAASARADETFEGVFGDYEEPQVVQTGKFFSFPYCECDKLPAGYRFHPYIRVAGPNRFCFTILTSNCSRPCCKADLNKVEFDVNPECRFPGARVNATLNGLPVRFLPQISLAEDGPVNSTILRITGLGLTPATANNAEICISLGTSRAGNGCTDLTALCKPPPGFPAGTCAASFMDANITCCPSSNGNVPSPPSPSPNPPSPPLPPPPCTETVCTSMAIVSAPPVGFFSFDAAYCNATQTMLAADLNAQLGALGYLTAPFTVNPALCSPTEITVCGGVSIPFNAVSSVSDLLNNQASLWLNKTECTAALEGYTLGIRPASTSGGSCLDYFDQKSCENEPTDFPFCNCTKQEGLPLTVHPVATTSAGPSARTNLHCFKLVSSERDLGVCEPTLNKVEFWANETLRTQVKSFRLIDSFGAVTTKAISWGPRGNNTLKVTEINWSVQQAVGASICIETLKDLPLRTLCLSTPGSRDQTCYVTFFDTSKDCCPTDTADAP